MPSLFRRTCQNLRSLNVPLGAILWSSLFLITTRGVGEDAPKVLDPNLELDLILEHPRIVTPVAVDVDDRGRVWVIESHTHHTKGGYDLHTSDRLLIVEDADGDGNFESVKVFLDGFRHAMGLVWRGPGDVYLATRMAVFRLRDLDGDDRCDEQHKLAYLTEGEYPHNGLSGLSFDDLGRIYVGMGENLGVPYRMIARDGSSLGGGTEGGDVFRMRPDGTQLERWATGFWNAFHMAFDEFGRSYVVDNDPDSRPPCRLLHVVRGGDYGYRFWTGRAGLHPFTSWNGELPGILPMMAGVGEAPSGVLAYQHGAFGPRYDGHLLSTSWGDHKIERFALGERDAKGSLTSYAETVVQGGEDFRPVGLAQAPDGSVYFSDWVKRSYPVHGHGRLWRLRAKKPAVTKALTTPRSRDAKVRELDASPDASAKAGALIEDPTKSTRERYVAALMLARRGKLPPGVLSSTDASAEPRFYQALVRLCGDQDSVGPLRGSIEVALGALAESETVRAEHRAEAMLHMRKSARFDEFAIFAKAKEPFLRSAAIFLASRTRTIKEVIAKTKSPVAGERLAAMIVLRRWSGMGRGFVPFGKKRLDPPIAVIREFLRDDDAEVLRTAIQWVGEESLVSLRKDVDAAVRRFTSEPKVLDAYMATLGLLGNENPKQRDKLARGVRLLRCLDDKSMPMTLRAWALRSLGTSEDLGQVRESSLKELLANAPTAIDAVRSLRDIPRPWAKKLLIEIASKDAEVAEVRLEAIAGLSSRELLLQLLDAADSRVSREAARALRGVELDADLAKRVQASSIGVKGPKPQTDEWKRSLLEGGSAVDGERVFFHPRGPRCASCHTVDGRGGPSGPDLTTIGKRGRDHVLASILEPAHEIAPQFATWVLMTRQGPLSGVLLQDHADGRLRLGTAEGIRLIPARDVLSKEVQTGSLMPDGLEAQLSFEELRDLLAFLSRER